MHSDLLAYLTANSGIAALVSNRVHWAVAPQGSTMPFIVLNQISGAPDYIYQGESGLSEYRIQIDAYATSYLSAKTLTTIIKTALSGLRFTQGTTLFDGCFVINERDLTEDTQSAGVRTFRVSVDFQIFFKEAA